MTRESNEKTIFGKTPPVRRITAANAQGTNQTSKYGAPNERNDFYFTVHSFMTHELGLRGSALIIYAIIYAFSKDGRGAFYGTMDFLAEHAGVGHSTVRAVIQSLLKEDFIHVVQGEKHELKHYVINIAKLKSKENTVSTSMEATVFSHHQNRANEVLKSSNVCGAEIEQRGAKIEQQGCSILMTGVLDSGTNNKYDNKYNNKPIMNSYIGADSDNNADAEIRKNEEKEKKDLKKDFDLSNKDFDDSRSYLASFAKSEKSNNGYSSHTESKKKGYEQKGASNGSYGQSREQGCKYGGFDPMKAFEEALARTELWFEEINERNKAAMKSQEKY